MAELDPESVRQAMTNAIAGALPGEMVIGWVAIVEIVDVEGERALWVQTADGQKAWTSLGMLAYAQNIELAATIHDED